jgi:DNA-binding MarR family transcriptional regulator
VVSDEAGLALLTEIHRAVHALGLAISRETDMTQAEALMLVLLYPGTVSLDEVHKTFLHRRSTLTNVVERLESSRLVRRETSAHDRRRFDLSLTPAGRRKAAQLRKLFASILGSSRISEGEATSSRETLAKLAAAAGT